MFEIGELTNFSQVLPIVEMLSVIHIYVTRGKLVEARSAHGEE
jgi:hypothetical protein